MKPRLLPLLLALCLLLSLPAGAAHPLDSSIIAVSAYLDRQEDNAAQVLAARVSGEEPAKKVVRSLQKAAGGEEDVDAAGLSTRILALTAGGTDPRDCGGVNYIDALCVSPQLQNESPRDLALALLALECGGFSPPDAAAAVWNREKLVSALLGLQQPDGGFGQSKNAMSDAQSTAMVLTALAPLDGMEKPVENGLSFLAGAIQNDGSFLSTSGDKNSEALSWSILALIASGSTIQEERFVKSGQTLVDSLFTFQNTDHGFSSLAGEKSSVQSSLPALCALASVRSGAPVFDFTGVPLSPYQTSAVKTYGSFILMTIGVVAVIYLMLLLTKRIAPKIDEKRTARKQKVPSAEDKPPEN